MNGKWESKESTLTGWIDEDDPGKDMINSFTHTRILKFIYIIYILVVLKESLVLFF